MGRGGMTLMELLMQPRTSLSSGCPALSPSPSFSAAGAASEHRSESVLAPAWTCRGRTSAACEGSGGRRVGAHPRAGWMGATGDVSSRK